MPGAATDLSLFSAGLDLVSGVFGYLTAQNSQTIASSRADMVRQETEADAQRYSEQAAQHLAQQGVMYLSSGVTLAGSPLAVLDTSARLARENMDAIRRHGEVEALDQDQAGEAAKVQGRNALVGGLGEGANAVGKIALANALFGNKTTSLSTTGVGFTAPGAGQREEMMP